MTIYEYTVHLQRDCGRQARMLAVNPARTA